MDNFFDRLLDSISGFGYGEYLIALLAMLVITLIIRIVASITFARYNKESNGYGITAAEAAEAILEANGIDDVEVTLLNRESGDHYNPRNKTIALSNKVYHSDSVAAMAVAAHEVGHAIQHHNGYLPLKVRNLMAPVAAIGSNFAFYLVLIGMIINGFSTTPIGYYVAIAGLALFLFAVIFSIVTLPMELNASKRARVALAENYNFDKDEMRGARRVLTAYAMTYVAALASAILSLLRMLSIIARLRRD